MSERQLSNKSHQCRGSNHVFPLSATTALATAPKPFKLFNTQLTYGKKIPGT